MPSVGKITHDHTYAKLSSNEMTDMTTELLDVRVEPSEVMNVTGEPDAIVDACNGFMPPHWPTTRSRHEVLT